MRKTLFVIAAFILFLLSYSVANAQQQPNTVTITRSVFEKSKQAADEVVVSRELISAQTDVIAELRENNRLLVRKVELLESINDAMTKQLVQKDITIQALTTERDTYATKVAKLERSNARWKKVSKVLGTIAIGSILSLTVF